MHELLRRPDDAVADFRTALEIDPNYAAARRQLETVLRARGRAP